MRLIINKQSAKALEKSLVFTLTACFQRDNNDLNIENIKLIGLDETKFKALCELFNKIKAINNADKIKRIEKTKHKVKTLIPTK